MESNMRILCSNCNTGQEVLLDKNRGNLNPVVKCRSCDKKIKIQFCPHCNAFYSVTFSNIKSGDYRYKCRKCGKTFLINFHDNIKPELPGGKPAPAPEIKRKETSPQAEAPVKEQHQTESDQKSHDPFSGKGINSFSLNELLRVTAESFTIQKIAAAGAGAALMLILFRLFTYYTTQFLDAHISVVSGTLATIFPLAILFSFYLLTASVIARITINRLISGKEPGASDITDFTLRITPSIILSNAILLLTLSVILTLFGKIPLLGPILFSLTFLPVYLAGITLTLLAVTGFWFYGPVAAHRDNGIISNMKNLMLFIKKHNLNLIFIIPAMTLLSSIIYGVIYIIHTAALTFFITISGAVLGESSRVFMSAAPASIIKSAEGAMAGTGGSAFRGLYDNATLAHTAGGMIIGISLFILTVLLFAIFVSVTATLSTHVYIMMERGIYIDDRKKLTVMVIIAAAALSAFIIKKLIL